MEIQTMVGGLCFSRTYVSD